MDVGLCTTAQGQCRGSPERNPWWGIASQKMSSCPSSPTTTGARPRQRNAGRKQIPSGAVISTPARPAARRVVAASSARSRAACSRTATARPPPPAADRRAAAASGASSSTASAARHALCGSAPSDSMAATDSSTASGPFAACPGSAEPGGSVSGRPSPRRPAVSISNVPPLRVAVARAAGPPSSGSAAVIASETARKAGATAIPASRQAANNAACTATAARSALLVCAERPADRLRTSSPDTGPSPTAHHHRSGDSSNTADDTAMAANADRRQVPASRNRGRSRPAAGAGGSRIGSGTTTSASAHRISAAAAVGGALSTVRLRRSPGPCAGAAGVGRTAGRLGGSAPGAAAAADPRS